MGRGVILAIFASGCFFEPVRPDRPPDGNPPGHDDGGPPEAVGSCTVMPLTTHDNFNVAAGSACGLGGEQGNAMATRSLGAVSFKLDPNQTDFCITGAMLEPTGGAFVTIADYQPRGAGDVMSFRIEHSAHFVEIALRNMQLLLTFDGALRGTQVAYTGAERWWRLRRGANQNAIIGEWSANGEAWQMLGEVTDASIDNTSGLMKFGAVTDNALQSRTFAFDSFNSCP